MLRNGIIGRRRWNGFSDRAVKFDLESRPPGINRDRESPRAN